MQIYIMFEPLCVQWDKCDEPSLMHSTPKGTVARTTGNAVVRALHFCVPSAQANSTPIFGAVGEKTECAITQRIQRSASDWNERVKARDKRLAHDTGTRKKNCTLMGTVALHRGG